MKRLITVLLLTPLLLAACDPNFSITLPSIEISPCDIQPELCNKSNAEFEEFFDGLTDEEQTAYVDAQFVSKEQTGFVSLGKVSQVYGMYTRTF